MINVVRSTESVIIKM